MSDLDPVTAGIIRQLARKVNGLEGRVRSLARGSQARHRSVEGGTQSLYDDDDELRAVVGQLSDGTYGVSTFGGAVPAVPSAPLISQIPNGATITWDGFDADDEQGWAEDFRRVRVHQVTVPGDLPDAENNIGAFESAAGGALTIAHPSDVTTYVSLVAESTSGLESAQSAEVPVTGGEFNLPDSGDLTAGSPFNGTARVYRLGDMALVTLNVNRASGFSNAYTDVGIVLPVGFRPAAAIETAPAYPFYTSAERYQFHILANGTVEVRQTGNESTVPMRATMLYPIA